MKLNDKGLKRLLDVAFDGDEFYQSNALEVEFEPGDFKGMVCLPIDEAKTIAHKLNDNSKFYYFQTENFDFETIELMDYLDDLIEQAESCNGSLFN